MANGRTPAEAAADVASRAYERAAATIGFSFFLTLGIRSWRPPLRQRITATAQNNG